MSFDSINFPYIPDEVLELMHEFSLFLLRDDSKDIGLYRYYKRTGHYYHGRHSPNHPSMLHHWQLGIAGLIAAQLFGMINMARDTVINPVEEDADLFEDSTVIDLDDSHYHTEEIVDSKPPELPLKKLPDIPLPPSLF